MNDIIAAPPTIQIQMYFMEHMLNKLENWAVNITISINSIPGSRTRDCIEFQNQFRIPNHMPNTHFFIILSGRSVETV